MSYLNTKLFVLEFDGIQPWREGAVFPSLCSPSLHFRSQSGKESSRKPLSLPCAVLRAFTWLVFSRHTVFAIEISSSHWFFSDEGASQKIHDLLVRELGFKLSTVSLHLHHPNLVQRLGSQDPCTASRKRPIRNAKIYLVHGSNVMQNNPISLKERRSGAFCV